MPRKPNIELENKVYEALKKNNFKHLREIAKQFDLSLGTVSKMKDRVEARAAGKTHKKRKKKTTQKTIRKLQSAAVGNQMIKRSQIIVNNVIDVLAGLKYSVSNLEEMQDKYSKEDKEIISELKGLNEKIEDFLETCVEEPNSLEEAEARIKAKMEMVVRIGDSINKVNDYYRRDTLRIKTIQELRKQFETFVNMEIVAKGITQVKEIIIV